MPDITDNLQNETPPNIAPNIDSELDAALSKSFAGVQPQEKIDASPTPKKDVAPSAPVNDEPSRQEAVQPKGELKSEVKQEIKSEETKKPAGDDKPLLSVDEIEKMDQKQASWTALKNNNKRAHRTIEQKDQEISKLKTTIAESNESHKKEVETLKSNIAELEKYRAMIDIQADPEFVSKYDQPIEKAVADIKSMLLGMDVTQETVDEIDFGNTRLLDEIVNHVTTHKDRFIARKLEGKIKDYLDLFDKRNETMEHQKKNWKETVEKRKQESFAKQTEGEGRMIKHIEAKASEKDKDGNPLIPFLNKIEVKENATPAEINQINNHNGLVDLLGKKLQEVSKMNEPEQRAEINIAAVASHYFKNMANAALARVKALEEELKKVSVVSSEAPARKPAAAVARNGNGEYVDTDAALAAHFNRSR